MKLTIDLSPSQAEWLRQEADRLGLAPEEFARAAIADLLAIPGDDFKAVAERERYIVSANEYASRDVDP